MFIVNKSEVIQRTVVKWNKQDLKPGEIVEVKKEEWLYVTKAYWDIFWVSEEATKKVIKKEVKREKKSFFKKD